MNELNKIKNDGSGQNPEKNRGACWIKCGKMEDFLLLKVQVDTPGNKTFVLFRNKNNKNEDGYGRDPEWFVFDYEPKVKSDNQ
jgi:hypothetical protein